MPGVEQFTAQQGDQRHRQQDQAEGQGLPGSCQGVTQQLAQAQAPGQAGTGQQPSQALQAQQQQAAQDECRDQAATEQGKGQQQVQAQAPHDQRQGQQGSTVDQPAARRHGQQVAAQHTQRWHPAQRCQRRQGKAGEGNQTSADPGQGRQQAAGRDHAWQ
ncbi:hypothetical protein D3C80_1070600 [compost metagenome]